jgi:hypothetical protein
MPWLRLYVAPPFANRRIPPFNSRRTHRILRSPRKSPEKRLRLYVAPPFANRRTLPLLIVAPLFTRHRTPCISWGVHLIGVHLTGVYLLVYTSPA